MNLPEHHLPKWGGCGQRDCRHPRAGSDRRGLSLLEVMLSLAILGGALAVIGELTRFGARNALMARDLATAQRLAENKMAEISAGLIYPDNISAAPVEELGDQDEWYYSVQVEPLEQQGLLAVWVVIEQNPAAVSRPVSFSLVRWMIDPMLDLSLSEDSLEGSTDSTGGGSSAPSSSSGIGGGASL
jgi:prepilin-type N-terminal cleavage/methylation domain-containing protein